MCAVGRERGERQHPAGFQEEPFSSLPLHVRRFCTAFFPPLPLSPAGARLPLPPARRISSGERSDRPRRDRISGQRPFYVSEPRGRGGGKKKKKRRETVAGTHGYKRLVFCLSLPSPPTPFPGPRSPSPVPPPLFPTPPPPPCKY